LDGGSFLYTNPLSYSNDLPFKQRWSKKRVPYISLSNCCPPNTVRTVARVSNYAYSISPEGVWFNLYGGNKLETLVNGKKININQRTEYPWDGRIQIEIEEVDSQPLSLFLRIPGWCQNARLLVNGKEKPLKA